MKVLIWIHKDEVVSGDITNYEFTRPYHDRNNEWVQVSITQDKFTRLEEALIFERNPQTGKIRSRKVGDYGNESDVDINEDVPFGD